MISIPLLLLCTLPLLDDDGFTSNEVHITVEGGEYELAGTLTLPLGDLPAPAVLLVTGSGDQVRDQVISGAPMFRWIAEHLSQYGFAVLRVDERGVGESTGEGWPAQDSTSRLEDVAACFEFLLEQERVDPARVGLLGHSEGSMLAPRLAAIDGRVAFTVLLAPPALPGRRIFLAQRTTPAEGTPEEQRALRAALSGLIDVSAAEATAAELRRAALPLLRAWGMTEPEIAERGQEEIDAITHLHTSPWYREFLCSDPVAYLSLLEVPTLALFGEVDEQTPPDLHLVPLARALLEAPVTDFAIHVLPEQDHFFLRMEGGAPGEHAYGKMHLSQDLLRTLERWLGARFGDE